MRVLVLGFLCLGLAASRHGFAQESREPSQEALEARYAAKTSKSFLRLVTYERDLTHARRRARDENKLIFAYLTRSYAVCPSCDHFEDTVLNESWWREMSEEVVPYLSITSRLPGHVDQEILFDLGGTRYPFVAFLDDDGRTLWPFVLRTRESFEEAKREAEAVLALRAAHRRTPGDRDAEVRWLTLLLRWNRAPEAELRLEELARQPLSEASDLIYKSFVASRRFREREARFQTAAATVSQSRRRALTSEFRRDIAELARQGFVIVEPNDPQHVPFWMAVGFALQSESGPLLDRALAELESKRKRQSWLDDILAQIRAGGSR